MITEELIGNLQYIANSPRQEYGGFHPHTVEIAKAALEILNGEWLDKPDKGNIRWWRLDIYGNRSMTFISDYDLEKGQHWIEGNCFPTQGYKWQKAIVPNLPKE